MKILGLALLLSGWILVVSALCLFPSPGLRNAFVLAGVAVEIVGFVLVARAHRALVRGQE